MGVLMSPLIEERPLPRRGNRQIAERLMRTIMRHRQLCYGDKSLLRIRELSPADYELYRAMEK